MCREWENALLEKAPFLFSIFPALHKLRPVLEGEPQRRVTLRRAEGRRVGPSMALGGTGDLPSRSPITVIVNEDATGSHLLQLNCVPPNPCAAPLTPCATIFGKGPLGR